MLRVLLKVMIVLIWLYCKEWIMFLSISFLNGLIEGVVNFCVMFSVIVGLFCFSVWYDCVISSFFCLSDFVGIIGFCLLFLSLERYLNNVSVFVIWVFCILGLDFSFMRIWLKLFW